jgi:hypothetical protein
MTTQELVEEWAGEINTLRGRIRACFKRVEVRERAISYLKGLLSTVERKNGWQLAEQMGESTPDGCGGYLAHPREKSGVMRIVDNRDATL